MEAKSEWYSTSTTSVAKAEGSNGQSEPVELPHRTHRPYLDLGTLTVS